MRLALLGGSFRYREQGLLDEGHLRFFTREGVLDLFESSGYLITQWLRRRLEVGETEISVPAVGAGGGTGLGDRRSGGDDVPVRRLRGAVRVGPRSFTPGGRSWARHGPSSSSCGRSRAESRWRERELEELRPLRGAVEELEALRRAHGVLQRRLVAERAAFAGGDRRGRGERLRLALVALHGAGARRAPKAAQAQAVTEVSLPRPDEPLLIGRDGALRRREDRPPRNLGSRR